MTVAEKVSYIKGLAEGLGVDDSTKEGKVLAAIVDVLDDIALTLGDIDEELNDVADVMTDMEESVDCLEDVVYGDEEDDYDDCDCDECCDEDDYDDDMYEVTCPNCGNMNLLLAPMSLRKVRPMVVLRIWMEFPN